MIGQRNTAYFEAAFEVVAERMMYLLTEIGPIDERWDPADAHEEIRESHPEMAAALRRNYERSKT